jgi:hypothetical protein
MNTYNVYYCRKEAEVQADSLYQAKLEAIKVFKVPKNNQSVIGVILAAKGNTPVTHSTAAL